MTARTILGPGACDRCGQRVEYVMSGTVRLGWRHPDGTYGCAGRTETADKRRRRLYALDAR